MLADFDVVVSDKAQGVSVSLSGILAASRCWPRGRADLHDKSFSILIPGNHALGVSPRRASAWSGIVIKLIIPNDVVVRSAIHLPEGGTQRVVLCCAQDASAKSQI